jgi:hypothetical protein
VTTVNPPLLRNVLPQFAAELEAALARSEPGLAPQVRELPVGRVCRCDDPTCATFDVPGRRPADYAESFALDELEGMVVVDVAEPGLVRRAVAASAPRIIGIEALGRPDLRAQLDACLEA